MGQFSVKIPRLKGQFSVALNNEAIERIKDGTITGYVYYPKTARLTTST